MNELILAFIDPVTAGLILSAIGVGVGVDSSAKARKAQRAQQRENRKTNAINAMYAPFTGIESKALDMRPASGGLEGAFKGAAQGLNMYNNLQAQKDQRNLTQAMTNLYDTQAGKMGGGAGSTTLVTPQTQQLLDSMKSMQFQPETQYYLGK